MTELPRFGSFDQPNVERSGQGTSNGSDGLLRVTSLERVYPNAIHFSVQMPALAASSGEVNT